MENEIQYWLSELERLNHVYSVACATQERILNDLDTVTVRVQEMVRAVRT
jgi:hypothetical protein